MVYTSVIPDSLAARPRRPMPGGAANQCIRKSETGLSMNRKKVVVFSNDLRGLTPHPCSRSPLRGEGAMIGHRHDFSGSRHSYDGVQRTARPAKFG